MTDISYKNKEQKKLIFTKAGWGKIRSIFTSFDVCRASDQLVKLLSGEEPGKEEKFEYH